MSELPHRRAAAHWFEIPAVDLDRAIGFYEAVLGVSLRRETMGSGPIAIFPYEEPTVGGNLSLGMPSADGTVIYLSCDGGLDEMLARVGPAGGAVLSQTALPPGMGHIAHIRDTEGNRVGLHSA